MLYTHLHALHLTFMRVHTHTCTHTHNGTHTHTPRTHACTHVCMHADVHAHTPTPTPTHRQAPQQLPPMRHLHGLMEGPRRLLSYLLLHVVVCLGLLGPNAGGLVAAVVASRVGLVHLWTPLPIHGDQNHPCSVRTWGHRSVDLDQTCVLSSQIRAKCMSQVYCVHHHPSVILYGGLFSGVKIFVQGL